MSEQSDTELIFLAVQGNKTAFDKLVLRYQPMAKHAAKRMISNEDLVQELVQDAMLQAYLSLGKLRDRNCFKSWLFSKIYTTSIHKAKIDPLATTTKYKV